ncbi:MAG: adenylate/guanylate cyclase domain-containing protein [Opitutaceae bacterium]|nr:adenylate/guanylate cyclase domain-containing protein [Opitutaceae bacterium]
MAQPKKKKFDWKFVALLPVPLLWAWLAQEGKLQTVENMLLDLRFRTRGELAAPVKIHYVNVDTDAIRSIGERPWNRARFAETATLLYEKGGAKAVGYDFVFSTLGQSELVNPQKAFEGNRALGLLARKHRQTVLAAQYTVAEEGVTVRGTRQFPLLRLGFTNREKNDVPELPAHPIISPTFTPAIGLIDFDYEIGGDATPRWAAMFAETNGPVYWHLAAQLTCIELGLPPGSMRRAGDELELFKPDGTVVRRIPLHHQQLLEVNWFSAWHSPHNPVTSMADVLVAGAMLASDDEAKRKEAEDYFTRFRDAIILIGPTDVLLQDLAPTPFDREPVPKVSAHGNLIKTIVAEKYLRRPPDWVMWACVLGLTAAVTGLTITGGARSLASKVLALIVLAGFVGMALFLFAQANLVLPMAAPLGAAFTTGFIATIWRLLREEQQKGRIKNMFGTYLAPELVNQMVNSETDPQLGGHEDVITAYFSDIQSFSTFSELMPPAQLVELMNEYLTACTDIVQAEKGTLDKYIGDAVVAIFGAPLPVPDHAYRACVATQRVQLRIEELRQKWRSEAGKWPPVVHVLRARLGLNTGSAIIGNMGSRTRFSYTMMGDNVNLAARMESGAKSLGVYTMCTEATRLECEKHGGDHVVFRYLDRIVVKGRTQPVPVFEIVGLKENVTDKTRECLAVYAQGIERYLAQDWDGALQCFAQSAALEPNQPSKAMAIDTNPSLVLTKRCHYMKEHPPGANWDGVYVMKEK